MEELAQINKRRNEIKKRIQEQQRLMELIQNRNLKFTTNTVELFKRDKAIKIIQRAFRAFKERQEQKARTEIEKQNAKYQFQAAKMGMDLNFVLKVIRIQKRFRLFLMRKNHQRIKKQYLQNLLKDYYKEIDYKRSVELRKEMTKLLRSTREVPKEDFGKVRGKYYQDYFNFCDGFPSHEGLREDNWLKLNQNVDMIKFMESIDPNNLVEGDQRFKKFMLDANKMPVIKKKVDEMERAYLHDNWWYLDAKFDDIEDMYILDEIDDKYHYENWKKLLGVKKI